MTAPCASCSAPTTSGARFCASCGAILSIPPEQDRAQRRRLSVVFCDLVGSTELSELLDPEDMRDLLGKYQEACARAVESAGGHVAQYLGDGVLVYFGYPQSNEDDARRAVRAALQIVESVAKIEAPPGAPPIAARIGIHTGLVVVGEVGRGGNRANLAVGETPNLAARLQGEAAPHQVVISAATLALVRGFFETEDLGVRSLRGVRGETRVHRVERETGVERRIEAAVKRGLTPFVGDHAGAETIASCWRDASAGSRRAILLVGEAGIGKSRHVQIAKGHAASSPRVECHCSPDLLNSAFHAFTGAFERLFGFIDADGPEVRFDKIRKYVDGSDLDGAEELALLANLMAVPAPASHPPLVLGARRQRQRTLELVLALVHSVGDRAALLLTVEDLHWADASTLEAIGLLLGQPGDTGLLIVATARPEFASPWDSHAAMRTMRLGRLGDAEVTRMIADLTGGLDLSPEVLRALIERSEGVPLFVEEITRAVLESGALADTGDGARLGSSAADVIRATAHETLTARLDRLGEGKRLAQVAAVVGRSFPLELLRAVTELEEAPFAAALAVLIDADVVRHEAESYSFRHALLRDAAYDSLLRSSRRDLHLRIAGAYETRFSQASDTHPERVAHHFHAGGAPVRAAELWLLAGQRALRRNAHIEAAALLRAALAALAEAPEPHEHALTELNVLMTLAPALIVSRGYAAPEVATSWTRAQHLCAVVGDVPQRVPALIGSWMFECIRARHADALALAHRIVALAEAAGSDDLRVEAHLCLGISSFLSGDLQAAKASFERLGATYHPELHASHRFQYGMDPAAVALAYLGLIHWLRGDAAKAREVSEECVAFARSLKHPFTLTFAVSLAGWLRLLAGERAEAGALLEDGLAVGAREGIPGVLGGLLMAWRLADADDPSAPERFQRAVAFYRSTGSLCFLPACEAAQADALSRAGRHAEAQALVAACVEAVENTGERWAEPDIHHRRGQILERAGAPAADIRACHVRALESARRLGIPAWEARAAEHLAAVEPVSSGVESSEGR